MAGHSPTPEPEVPFSPNAEDLLSGNASFAEHFDDATLEVQPTRHLTIVTCMDSRIDVFKVLGLENGEAHIIRNAGGVITDDVIRSLCLSQRFLGTQEIVLVHHTDCGLQHISEDEFKTKLESELGIKPWWALESFEDPYADVLQSMHRLHLTPFVEHKEYIRGFVYDVTTGKLNEVVLD